MVYNYKDSDNVDQYMVFYWFGMDSKKSHDQIVPPTTVLLDGQYEALMVKIII